jgi:hypothetical protein
MDAFLQTRLHFTNPEEGSSLLD